MSIERELLALREGRITFDHFIRNTRAYWFGIAKGLVSRYPATGTCVDDVVQDMWLYLVKYEPVQTWDGEGRHGSLTHYAITYGAAVYAKRQLHRMRGAVQRHDNGVGREEVPVSWTIRADATAPWSNEPVAMTPSVRVEIEATLDALNHAETDRQREVVRALGATRCIDTAAQRLQMSRASVMEHARKVGRLVQAA